MDIVSGLSLRFLNTMGLPAQAEYFCRVASLDDLQEALSFSRSRRLPLTVLGGGSNIIFAGDVAGLVVQIALPGMATRPQHDAADTVLATAGAGEVWHEFVLNMLAQHCYGLENLALIPGLVGAAPVQNIGAYGVELSDIFVALDAVEIASGQVVRFTRTDCQFGYRHSVFKENLRDAYIITAVTLRLRHQPRVNIGYPALRQVFGRSDAQTFDRLYEQSVESLSDQSPREMLMDSAGLEITPQRVCEAVCRIRRERLPDPDVEPNVGSFFKNPIVSAAEAEALAAQYADIALYRQPGGLVKIPAAWLIERAGWKGLSKGECRVHERHALVLTHSGKATGADILALAGAIVADIKQRFSISLEMEPHVLGG